MVNTNKEQCSIFWWSSGPLGTQITLNRQIVKLFFFSIWLCKQFYCDHNQSVRTIATAKSQNTCLGSCWSRGRVRLRTAGLQRGCVSLTCLQKTHIRERREASRTWQVLRSRRKTHRQALGSAWLGLVPSGLLVLDETIAPRLGQTHAFWLSIFATFFAAERYSKYTSEIYVIIQQKKKPKKTC